MTSKAPYVVIIFETLEARPQAQSLLLQQEGADVLLIAPDDLCPSAWVAEWGRHAREVILQMNWRENLSDPIEILARADAVHVVRAGDAGPAPEGAVGVSREVAQLMGLASLFEVPCHLYSADGGRVQAPLSDPQLQSLAQRVAKALASAPSTLASVDEVHVCCDFYATGLWNARGQMLAFDPKILPFSLIRRLSAWQWDYDRTFNPPEEGDPAWWAQNFAESCAIARELQSVLGEAVTVKVDGPGGDWVWIGAIDLATNEVLK